MEVARSKVVYPALNEEYRGPGIPERKHPSADGGKPGMKATYEAPALQAQGSFRQATGFVGFFVGGWGGGWSSWGGWGGWGWSRWGRWGGGGGWGGWGGGGGWGWGW